MNAVCSSSTVLGSQGLEILLLWPCSRVWAPFCGDHHKVPLATSPPLGPAGMRHPQTMRVS